MANCTSRSSPSVYALVFTIIFISACIAFVASMAPYRHGGPGRLALGIVFGVPLGLTPGLLLLMLKRFTGARP